MLWRLWLLVWSDQASKQGTMSPIELFWTAKKGHNFAITRPFTLLLEKSVKYFFLSILTYCSPLKGLNHRPFILIEKICQKHFKSILIHFSPQQDLSPFNLIEKSPLKIFKQSELFKGNARKSPDLSTWLKNLPKTFLSILINFSPQKGPFTWIKKVTIMVIVVIIIMTITTFSTSCLAMVGSPSARLTSSLSWPHSVWHLILIAFYSNLNFKTIIAPLTVTPNFNSILIKF